MMQASPPISPTARASAAICWWAPTASAPAVRAQFLPDVAAGLCRLCGLARGARRSRCAARPMARDGRTLRVLSARGRAADQLRGAGARQRHGGRTPRLQYRLVSAGRSRDARRHLHRRQGPPSRRRHSAAADPARRDRPRQSRRQGASSRRRSPRFSRAPRRSSSRSTISRRRVWCSAASCSPAMRLSSRVRMPAPAPPRRRSMRPASPTAFATPAAIFVPDLPRLRALAAAVRQRAGRAQPGRRRLSERPAQAESRADRRRIASRYRRGVARPYQPQRSGRRYCCRPRP